MKVVSSELLILFYFQSESEPLLEELEEEDPEPDFFLFLSFFLSLFFFSFFPFLDFFLNPPPSFPARTPAASALARKYFIKYFDCLL